MKTTFWQNHDRGFYFRVFGYGLAFEKDAPPRFSERVGAQKVLRIGRWAIMWLTA